MGTEFLFRKMERFRDAGDGDCCHNRATALTTSALQTRAALVASSYMYVDTANVRDEINPFNACDCVAYLVIQNVGKTTA